VLCEVLAAQKAVLPVFWTTLPKNSPPRTYDQGSGAAARFSPCDRLYSPMRAMKVWYGWPPCPGFWVRYRYLWPKARSGKSKNLSVPGSSDWKMS
jgi:hypothetical protein